MVTKTTPRAALDELPETPGAYLLLHKLSGQCYVGSTGNLRCRLQLHSEALARGEHSNVLMQLAHDLDYEFEYSAIPTADRAAAAHAEEQLRQKYEDGRLFNHVGPCVHHV